MKTKYFSDHFHWISGLYISYNRVGTAHDFHNPTVQVALVTYIRRLMPIREPSYDPNRSASRIFSPSKSNALTTRSKKGQEQLVSDVLFCSLCFQGNSINDIICKGGNVFISVFKQRKFKNLIVKKVYNFSMTLCFSI